MEFRKPGLREIINIRKIAFAEQNGERDYTVRRGMNREATLLPEFKMRERGYADLLPVIDGQRIDEIIESRIEERGRARILDLGCGEGNFLLDCKQRWGENVETFGISAFKFHDEEKMDGSRIKIGLGDAQSLIRVLKKNNMPTVDYDIAVSVFAMNYIADQLAVIKQAYRVLSIGGFGIFDSTSSIRHLPSLDPQDNRRGFWFRKTGDKLSLPDVKYRVFVTDHFTQLTYENK